MEKLRTATQGHADNGMTSLEPISSSWLRKRAQRRWPFAKLAHPCRLGACGQWTIQAAASEKGSF